jgi:hypothetical protein
VNRARSKGRNQNIQCRNRCCMLAGRGIESKPPAGVCFSRWGQAPPLSQASGKGTRHDRVRLQPRNHRACATAATSLSCSDFGPYIFPLSILCSPHEHEHINNSPHFLPAKRSIAVSATSARGERGTEVRIEAIDVVRVE